MSQYVLVSSEEELGEGARCGDMIAPEGARIFIVHARHLLLYCEVELISAQVLCVLFIGEVLRPDRDQGPESFGGHSFDIECEYGVH